MDKFYDHQTIEKKWQQAWDKQAVFVATEKDDRKKFYALCMFPYPSSAGLHVGHPESYTAIDIVARFKRLRGYNVLNPMGWDAFGLPAENYAIKVGTPPWQTTASSIKNFTRQVKSFGFSYDWKREINTSDPSYYKWTQWLFLQLLKNGLAYKKKAKVNWCEHCQTVLANEQVVDNKCERCGFEVMQKDLEQWFFKITDYADRLIDGLSQIDWLEEVKTQQKNWIGRKEGINITYDIDGYTDKVTVFTTAPVNFGATFLVIAPEHELISKIMNGDIVVEDSIKNNVKKYYEIAKSKSDQERIAEGKEKTGEFTGLYAINHLTNEKLPIWITDFVLANVGTGAVQGCPGHDKRDFQFAKKFDLPIKRVVVGTDGDESPIESENQVVEHGKKGTFINSEFLNGMDFEEGLQKTMDYFEQKGWGNRVISYHIRDWLISRQRYWGCPIPMIYCDKCGWNPVPEKELPVLLPTDVDFLPHGESPIARSTSFQKDVLCPSCGKPARREVDTMDTYVDSSWYFLRFCDPKNTKEFAAKNKIIPVDDYVGGGHVVQHLLFARFFWKVLFDLGYIDKKQGDEPFLKLRAPGWILGPDSRKMSKRWGNVVTPDDIIPKFGADTLRVYEMFMGPFDIMKPWSAEGVEGAHRFLGRVWRMLNLAAEIKNDKPNQKLIAKTHQTIKKVGDDIENYKFNTAISSLMELVNTINTEGPDYETLKTLTLLIAPFAPHMVEEAWSEIFNEKNSIHLSKWPEYNQKYLVQDKVIIAIQINGKLRGTITVTANMDKEEVLKLAKSDEKVAQWLNGGITKEIFIPNRLVNFVV